MSGTINHYLYKDIEVRSTGRYVNKPNTVVRKVDHFIEITPVDEEINWTKFVSIDDLYLIQTIAGTLENKGELVLLKEIKP
jgi:hypothetical protein